jgi:hypothetical protein
MMKRNELKLDHALVGAVTVCLWAGLALAGDNPSPDTPQRDQLYVRLLGTSP